MGINNTGPSFILSAAQITDSGTYWCSGNNISSNNVTISVIGGGEWHVCACVCFVGGDSRREGPCPSSVVGHIIATANYLIIYIQVQILTTLQLAQV